MTAELMFNDELNATNQDCSRVTSWLRMFRKPERSTTPCKCPRRLATPTNQGCVYGTGSAGAYGKISPASCSGNKKPCPPHSTASHDLPRSCERAACSLSARRD